MHDSPPIPPIGERTTTVLIEDLCIALRNVALNDGGLPDGECVVGPIKSVRELHSELVRRCVDCMPRLGTLSEETGWQIPQLLDDCLGFPATLPYVREPDGIRRFLRCGACGRTEHPPDVEFFPYCESCMRQLAAALRDRTPTFSLVFYRTYNEDCWCRHANADTVFASGYYYDNLEGACEQCIEEELLRRRASPQNQGVGLR